MPRGNLVSIIPTLGSLSIADDPFCGAVNAWRRRSGSELHPIFRRQWALAVVDEVNVLPAPPLLLQQLTCVGGVGAGALSPVADKRMVTCRGIECTRSST